MTIILALAAGGLLIVLLHASTAHTLDKMETILLEQVHGQVFIPAKKAIYLVLR